MKKISLLCLVAFSFSVTAQVPLQVNLMALKGADDKDRLRITSALEIIEAVVNSEEFSQRVLSMKYKIGQNTYQGYTQTNHEPRDILSSIFTATENFSGGSPGVIDLKLQMYFEQSNTVGFTRKSDPLIYMNRFIHGEYSALQTAGNIFHEWLHKLNYGHSGRPNSKRPHSVPYKLGRIVAEMAAELEAQGDELLKGQLIQDFEQGLECHHKE